MNLDSLKNLDKKYWILGGISLVVLLFVLIFGAKSTLFRGTVGVPAMDPPPSASDIVVLPCETQQENYEADIETLINEHERIEALNELNSGLEGYADRESSLNEIAEFLEFGAPQYNCDLADEETLNALEVQARQAAQTLISIEEEINSLPICPLEFSDETNLDYLEFQGIEATNVLLNLSIDDLNAETYWGEEAQVIAKNIYVLLTLLKDDFNIDGAETEIRESLEGHTVTQDELETLREEYLDLLISKFQEGAYFCNFTDIIEIRIPLECPSDEHYDEDSGVCMPNEPEVPATPEIPEAAQEPETPAIPESTQCTVPYAALDRIYDILESFKEIPENFTPDAWSLIEIEIAKLDETQGLILSYDDFHYRENANELVVKLNLVIADLTDVDCSEKAEYALLEITEPEVDPEQNPEDPNVDPEAGNTDNSDTQVPETTEVVCPENATAYAVESTSVCICDVDRSRVEADGECPSPEDPEDDTNNDLYTCDDGSVVLSEELCPIDTSFVYTCPDGSSVADLNLCPASTILYCADGITQVSDLAQCPENQPNTGNQTDPETTDTDHGTAETIYVCADGFTQVSDPSNCPSTASNGNTSQTSYDEQVYADQDVDGLNLNSNTDSAVLDTPEVQGDTGPGEIIYLALMLSALGVNFIRSKKFN